MIEYLIATDDSGKWSQNNDFHKRLEERYKSHSAASIKSAQGVSTGLSTFEGVEDLRLYDINGVAVLSGKNFDVDCVMIGDKDRIQETKQKIGSETGFQLGFCPW